VIPEAQAVGQNLEKKAHRSLMVFMRNLFSQRRARAMTDGFYEKFI